MYGDERVRFCSQCNLNVYNLSSMTLDEAEVLLLRTEGRLCVRYFVRKDGTVLTKDCPIGLQAIKDRRRSTKSRVARAILSLIAYSIAMIVWSSQRLGSLVVLQPTMGDVISRGPQNPTPVVQVEEKEMRKRAILKVDPVCRASCGRERIVVRIIVNQHGFVESSSCTSRNPKHRELVEEAARAWKFSPTLIAGVPARAESTLTMTLD
jgi:hypothetical protein